MIQTSMLRKIVRNHLEEHRSIYMFSGVLLAMGVIFGAIIVNSLSFLQKNDLLAYLSVFFGQVEVGEFASPKQMFTHTLMHHIKYISLMWFLGLSVIGIPIIFILLFIKGIVVGFTVGFLVNQLGFNGFILAFVSVLPQNIILIPVFIIIATTAISFSLRVWRQITRRVHQPITQYFIPYGAVLVVAAILLVFISAYEAFLSPSMMKTVYIWINK